jgi:hypothetical protein
MSILTATSDDFQGGRSLPNGTYRVTVLDAKIEHAPDGAERLTRMYGNIRRAADGATEFTVEGQATPFRVGNRKLFARSWITHSNEQAQSIGQREIKREAVAAGLMVKPGKGEAVQLDVNEEYAMQLIGKEVLVRTQLKPRYVSTITGQAVYKPTPEQLSSGEVVEGRPEAEVVNWVQA